MAVPGFFVLAGQRSGSTWFVDMLNSHAGIRTYSELFLEGGDGVPPWSPSKDVVYWNTYRSQRCKGLSGIRQLCLKSYLDHVFLERKTNEVVGVKLMYDQFRKFPECVLYSKARRIPIIHLIRENVVAMYVSAAIMRKSGVAHSKSGEAVRHVKVELDPEDLSIRVGRVLRMRKIIKRVFQAVGVRAMSVTYEELDRNPKEFQRVEEFLGLPSEPLCSSLVKVRSGELAYSEQIANVDEVLVYMKGSPYFGMVCEALGVKQVH